MSNVVSGFLKGNVEQDKREMATEIIACHLHRHDVDRLDKSVLTNKGLIELHQRKAVDRFLDDPIFRTKVENIIFSLACEGVI